jgi:tetratricopeptide (TPR) repeat protein
MWLERRLEIVCRRGGPIILVGDPAWGAPYLIHALNEPERPLVWVELEPRDQSDLVLQGNKLADAVRRALGSPLFGYGMPFQYGLNVLRNHLGLLGPFTYALSGAEHAPELARDLLALCDGKNRVVLAVAELPKRFCLPGDTCVLGPDHLRLSEDEAFALAQGRLLNEEVQAIYEETGGALEPFLIALNDALGLPMPLRPGPEGATPIPGYEPKPDVETFLDVLLARERYLEALELAAERRPERVPEVLTAAGEFFWMRGLQARVARVLESLPPHVRSHELVLTSRLVAALALGTTEALLPEVERALAGHDLPNVRALYAEALYERGETDGFLKEAARAVDAGATSVTLYIYGGALGLSAPEEGLHAFERAFRLAKHEGSPLRQGLIAAALAGRHTTLGNYRTAVSWATWGRRLYQEGALDQVALRLSLLNEWAYARVLGGGVAGLETELHEAAANLSEVRPALAQLFRTTLADVLLSQGRAEEAADIYRQLWRDNTRRQRVGAIANLLVRALIELGDVRGALDIAERAMHVTQGLEPLHRRRAKLAYGLALSMEREEDAIPVLEAAMTEFQAPLLAGRLAQAALHLARCYARTGEHECAREALERARVGLAELSESGLRYLAGPYEAFQAVREMLSPRQAPLELRFLGGIDVRHDGQPLDLRPRFAELLAALALHPQGLTAEQLTLAVYGERGDPRHCRLEISRLRKLVPISSRPYRIAVDSWTDFAELEQRLVSGTVAEALELYRGPLLPTSDAPFIAETRAFLEESLRQAVLSSGEVESLWTLAERLKNDLGLWKAVLGALHQEDPRRAVAQARVARLHRDFDP